MGLDGGMRSRLAWVVVAVVVLAGGAGAAWWWQHREGELDAGARAAATAYAAAFSRRDLSGVASTQSGAAADFAAAVKGLGAATVRASAGSVARDGSAASARLAVRWSLGQGATWSYEVPVRLVEEDGRWRVTGPSTGTPWAPGLATGQTLFVERTAAARGDLLDRDGKPLMPQGTVHVVQLDPVKATPASAAALEKATDATPGSLVKALAARRAASSQAPIPVISYRDADWAARRAAVTAAAGAFVTEATQPLGATRSFGQPLLGTFGEVTKEVVDASNGRYLAGDRAGLSGLQGQYDATLAGTPGLRVVSSAGTDLFTAPATEGTDVRTTLDPTVQRAAESALAASALEAPGAIVAVDVTSGEVLAAANSPSTGFDRAITGRYPPGSTFKVATSYAYLTKGVVAPTTVVACPTTATVDGLSFKNFDGESISGSPTFFDDFTHSCNTAFAGLSPKLGASDLHDAAKALGIGAGWADGLGVANAFEGSIPTNTGGTDTAAAAIGQGRDEVSPLALAVMAGSVGRGTFVAPVLVRTADTASPRPVALDGRVVAQLRSMMASVVSSGTATVLRGTPGGPVRGKTGTAQHGNDRSVEPYVWFTGYQGTVAFAVLVEAGTSGGTDAAPVAKRFLTTLAGS